MPEQTRAGAPLTLVAVSQRVEIQGAHRERRDALDQRWIGLLSACGITPVVVPNSARAAEAIFRRIAVQGILLTGGNDLAVCGGDAPERDETERVLLDYALRTKIPILGVCRGMQVIQHYYGVSLKPVEGHVGVGHGVDIDGRRIDVNSHHRFGATETPEPLVAVGTAKDGVVESIRHEKEAVRGIMWHPERFDPFRPEDIAEIRTFFNVAGPNT